MAGEALITVEMACIIVRGSVPTSKLRRAVSRGVNRIETAEYHERRGLELRSCPPFEYTPFRKAGTLSVAAHAYHPFKYLAERQAGALEKHQHVWRMPCTRLDGMKAFARTPLPKPHCFRLRDHTRRLFDSARIYRMDFLFGR